MTSSDGFPLWYIEDIKSNVRGVYFEEYFVRGQCNQNISINEVRTMEVSSQFFINTIPWIQLDMILPKKTIMSSKIDTLDA